MGDSCLVALAFNSVEKRGELFYRIISEGFNARMHSYEYFVRGKKFVCIIVLHPLWNSATIHHIPWNIEESEEAVERIAGILREMEPTLTVEVV
jgi:hypothetical protein